MTALTSGNTLVGDDWDISPEKESDAALRSQAEKATPWSGEKLAGWARNWHWNDCAEDKPVDPSIYFRDMRMLKDFLATQPANSGQQSPPMNETDPAHLTAELLRLKNRFDRIFNNVLVDMKPGWDDSIEGFNKAWDIARDIFQEEIGRATAAALSREEST